jgi:hypothetical protein
LRARRGRRLGDGGIGLREKGFVRFFVDNSQERNDAIGANLFRIKLCIEPGKIHREGSTTGVRR